MTIYITKRDGTKELFNADLINRSIERACQGFIDPVSMVTQIATETRLTLYDGITTDELDQATINAAVQNIKEDIDYDKVATRLLLKTVYRKVIGEYDKESADDLKKKHRDGFIRYIRQGIAHNRLHADMAAKYDLEAIADTLDIALDCLKAHPPRQFSQEHRAKLGWTCSGCNTGHGLPDNPRKLRARLLFLGEII